MKNIKKKEKDPINYLPLRKRAANVLIDGYIHMPREVISSNVTTNDKLTVIQGVLCLSINQTINVDKLDINVRGESTTRFFNGTTSSDQEEEEEEEEERDIHSVDELNCELECEIPSKISRIKSKLTPQFTGAATFSKQSATFLNLNQTILRSDHRTNPTLEARCHYVPFEFCIDDERHKLPPSFTGRYGSIRYQAVATLISPDLPQSRYTTQFTFSVTRSDIIPRHALPIIPDYYRTKIIHQSLYKFQIPKIFYPRERYAFVKLDIWKLNPTLDIPTSVTFYLREVQTYSANLVYPTDPDPPNTTTQRQLTHLRKLHTTTLDPLSTTSSNLHFGTDTLLPLPLDLSLRPTITNTPLITIRHTLILEFHLPSSSLTTLPHLLPSSTSSRSFQSEFPIKLQSLPRKPKITSSGPPTYIAPPEYTL